MKFEPVTEHADLARWKIALIAAVLVGIVTAVMLWAQRLTATQNVVGTPGMFPHRGAITSVEELVSESTKENLVGRQVVLTYVEVTDVISADMFFVAYGVEAVPVVVTGELVAGDEEPRVSAGDRVHILGIVQRAPAPRVPEQLRAHEIYVSALQVSVVSGGDQRGDETPRTAEQPARDDVPPRVITSVSQLASVAPAELQARPVVLREIRVVRVLGDHTFVVGDEQSTAVVALMGEMTNRQAERTTVIRAGDVVRIYGTVRRLRSVEEIEQTNMLTADQEAQLRAHEVYISALRVVQLEPSS